MTGKLFFETEDGIMFPVERISTDDMIVVRTDTKAAADRVKKQFPEELADQLIVIAVGDTEIVNIEATEKESAVATAADEQAPKPEPEQMRRPGSNVDSREGRTPSRR